MKRLLSIAAIVPLLFALGCASFVGNAKKTEYATAKLADGAMQSWAVYYKAATNNPAQYGTTLDGVEKMHSQVNALSKKVGASLHTVNTFVDAYAANSATKTALQSAIDAAASNASELVTLISPLTGKTEISTK
jgi:ABC-type transporter Mla subunit MlaD